MILDHPNSSNHFIFKTEAIIVEGAQTKQRIFQILSGSCRLEAKGVTIAQINEGEVFGISSFLISGKEDFSVIADEVTQIIKLEGYYLNILFQQYDDLGPKFYKFLALTLVNRIDFFVHLDPIAFKPSLKDPSTLIRKKKGK